MELLLICGIVACAVVIAARRILRTLRTPPSPCCGCDTCTQPDAVKSACLSGQPQQVKGACSFPESPGKNAKSE